MSIDKKVKELEEKVEEFDEKHMSEGSGPLGYSWPVWIFCAVVVGLIKYFELF